MLLSSNFLLWLWLTTILSFFYLVRLLPKWRGMLLFDPPVLVQFCWPQTHKYVFLLKNSKERTKMGVGFLPASNGFIRTRKLMTFRTRMTPASWFVFRGHTSWGSVPATKDASKRGLIAWQSFPKRRLSIVLKLARSLCGSSTELVLQLSRQVNCFRCFSCSHYIYFLQDVFPNEHHRR